MPPRTGGSVVLALVRVVVGLVFVVASLEKFVSHSTAVAHFRHWGLPSPSLFVYVIGAVELLAGAALALGLATRTAALLLLADMVGAVATAGRVDGGMHVVVPPFLGLLSLILLARGGGRWQLLDRFDPPPAPRSRPV
jgi:uncharacterized membrane protein YphA (DoxX/SURF4 family)